jgi:hypothetical protein
VDGFRDEFASVARTYIGQCVNLYIQATPVETDKPLLSKSVADEFRHQESVVFTL